jgi:adenylosuccinate synthase
MKKGAYIIVGAQWGDEGKGLISAYINAREKALAVYRAGTGANAEHGIFLEDEKTYLKTNQLPLGWIFNPDTLIRVGSGVAVDPNKLIQEINTYNLGNRVRVDYRCPIITEKHIQAEQESKGMKDIGSTFSGTGFCRADFVLRKAKQAKDISSLFGLINNAGKEINHFCKEGTVIVECSQGTWLSLALSNDYPNVTSDNVTAVAAADDVLLNWKNIKEVVLVVKALPTREGAGNFGSVEEIHPDHVKEAGMFEPSSIGGVQRRKATGIDFDLLRESVEINGATQIALTFCDHYDPKCTNAKKPDEITDKVWDLIERIEFETKLPVTILNTGKAYNNIIDLSTNNTIDWESIGKRLQEYA